MKQQTLVLAVLSVSLGIVAGCSTSAGTSPNRMMPAAMAPTTMPATAQKVKQTEFWYSLARKGSVTNDEATRGMLLSVDDPTAAGAYEERVARMKATGLLPAGFNASATARATRGDLAVGFCKILGLGGGVNQMVFGPTPRYCTRTLVFEGFYPDSTEQQAFSGAEFVGVIGAADDRRRVDPTNYPAESIPGYIEKPAVVSSDGSPVLDYRQLPLILTEAASDSPLYMQASTQADGPVKLKVYITAVQGDEAEYRKDASSPWEPAEEAIVLDERAEFRTGDKSSIRFNIPPGQTFTLDRLGSCSVSQAVQLGNTVKTQVAVEQGRLRMDVNETAPAIKEKLQTIDKNNARIAEAGVVHETSIRSPNSALAVRGTRVSLFDQAPYAPRAVSLTGRAEYINTRKQAVAFGGTARAQVQGAEEGAAQNAAFAANPRLPSAVIAQNFDLAQQNRVIATGGFIRGDVVVGNAGVDVGQSFRSAPLAFVLSFGAPGTDSFQDLNLGVITPLSSSATRDFVANGPYTGSLNPNRAGYDEYRATLYPKTSALSGGTISKNSVTVPERFAIDNTDKTTSFRGTEFAVFGENYPKGLYRIAVTNFIDVPDGVEVANKGSNPVPATVQVVVNGRSFTLGQQNFPVGLYETVVLNFDTNQIPQEAFSAVPLVTKKLTKPQLVAQQRAANKVANKALRDAQKVTRPNAKK